MGGLSDCPRTETPQWEPEPLHLPIDAPPIDIPSDIERRQRGNRDQLGHIDYPSDDYPSTDSDDLPGSYVIVIDLA